MHLLLPIGIGMLERFDFTSMRLMLGGFPYAHTGELLNEMFRRVYIVVVPTLLDDHRFIHKILNL